MELEAVAELEVEMEQIGPQGYSAYEVYVQNGGTLSETEWLASLKGKDGQNGSDGLNGTNGQDGITPTIGDNGNWYLGNTDTGKPSRGEKGDTGGVSLEEVTAITGNLENLNTEDKSNLVNAINEVANSSGGSSGIEFVDTINSSSTESSTYTNFGREIGEAIIKVTENGTKNGILIIKNNQEFGIFKVSRSGTSGSYSAYIMAGTSYFTQSDLDYSYFYFIYGQLSIDSSNVVKVCNVFKKVMYNQGKLLTMNNTTSYTPSSDYNPTTKKYVDDAIASAITTSLEAGY